jgi:hypothetical protein
VSQTNPVNNNPSYLYKIPLNVIHPGLGLPSGPFPFGCPTNNLYAFPFYPLRATCPAHHNFLVLRILIKLGGEYKSSSSSLWNCFHPPVTSSHFGPSILITILFSNAQSPCSYLNVRDQVLHLYGTTEKFIFLKINLLPATRTG